ncbi:MAG TPA: carbohydrate porin [Candidatus Acidoferrum sp.]|nr:carbohydrate porin [Candidatus Acidoferrum sp.]
MAVVTNGICKDHQIYFADGGLGFLLGDGALRYGRENIEESYYTAHVWRGIYIAPGVQHINNPGYITGIAARSQCQRFGFTLNSS